MPPDSTTLTRARDAFERKAWSEALALFEAAAADRPLEAEDLGRVGVAAFLLGQDAVSQNALASGFRLLADRGEAAGAARFAFWVWFSLDARGEAAPAAGWLGRGRRLLDEQRLDCVERGYLLLPAALQKAKERDPGAALPLFAEAAAIGRRFGDRDLAVLARHGEGRALILTGDTARGIAILDEIMAAVTSGEVSPVITGLVYCSVISACHELFDLARAREWTAALTRWCAEQPGLVPYRGACLVRRAEIMRLRGAWEEAMAEAELACRIQGDARRQPDAGAAWYQRAELHRLRGRFQEAEEAYREANRLGRAPWPGLALLRLAQGDVAAARTALTRVLGEARDRRTRALALPACIEASLAAGDLVAARTGADALDGIARELDTPLLHAIAGQARGAVLLREERPEEALKILRQAWREWAGLEAPYEAACVRALTGMAFRALGQHEAAALEFDAAATAFRELGAAPDLARLEVEMAKSGAALPAGLTPRELEVLRLVASGRTNRAIADELQISEKTVARHLSNIFLKLGLSTRAAATAWAYQHNLV